MTRDTEFDTDFVKDETVRMLLAPLEVLAIVFQDFFKRHSMGIELYSLDWGLGQVILVFDRNPSSDAVKDVLFGLYEFLWGGKPEGLDCVYGETQSGVTAMSVVLRPETLIKWMTNSAFRNASPLKRCLLGIFDIVDYQYWKLKKPPRQKCDTTRMIMDKLLTKSWGHAYEKHVRVESAYAAIKEMARAKSRVPIMPRISAQFDLWNGPLTQDNEENLCTIVKVNLMR